MTDELTIIGTPISPYVRKVLAILDMKGVPFRCIPQVPFLGDDEFTRISPLRRIPVLKIGDFTLPDSTAIVQYLEEAYEGAPAYPGDAKARARARWYEEYADDHLGRNIFFNLFFQRVVRPRILKQEPDQALIDEALNVGLPKALEYLEREVPDTGFLCGDIGVADIMVGAIFRSTEWADWTLKESEWPRVAAYLDRVLANPSLKKANDLGQMMMTSHPRDHQAVVDTYYGKG